MFWFWTPNLQTPSDVVCVFVCTGRENLFENREQRLNSRWFLAFGFGFRLGSFDSDKNGINACVEVVREETNFIGTYTCTRVRTVIRPKLSWNLSLRVPARAYSFVVRRDLLGFEHFALLAPSLLVFVSFRTSVKQHVNPSRK